MKFKDKFPELAFKDESRVLIISRENLTSLEGCPKIIHGSFYCSVNNLESLVGGPERVGGHYFCNNNNQLQSLNGIASYIGDWLSFEDSPIESIAGIQKKISYFGGKSIWAPKSCKKGLLDVFKMNAPNLEYFQCGNKEVNDIFDKYLKLVKSGHLTKSQAMLQCQSELIENDLDEYTEY